MKRKQPKKRLAVTKTSLLRLAHGGDFVQKTQTHTCDTHTCLELERSVGCVAPGADFDASSDARYWRLTGAC